MAKEVAKEVVKERVEAEAGAAAEEAIEVIEEIVVAVVAEIATSRDRGAHLVAAGEERGHLLRSRVAHLAAGAVDESLWMT